MNALENNDESLRSAAIQTSQTILVARQRAEQELIQAKEALEVKTKELAESLALMRATLESTTDGILVTDCHGNVTHYNEKFLTMWEMPRELMHDGNSERRQEFAGRRFANPMLFNVRLKEILYSNDESFDLLELADGKILERYSKFLDGQNSSPCRVWIFRDITERHLAEDKLKTAKNEAERASKAKDDFLAALSHELRTPLTPVLMATTAMREDKRLPDDVREQLGMMERHIALEVRLIDDLLDITAITRGKLRMRTQLSDAHSLIGLALEIVRDEALTKQITITREFLAQRSGIVVDPARFQQVIWNLLRNGLKFTPRGGHILIATADAPDNRLRIAVTDSGIGIEPDALEKIFLPFEQGAVVGDHRYGGMGLGLSIARAIVNLHGGKIHADSNGANNGATFIVEFPDGVEPPHGVAESAPPSAGTASAETDVQYAPREKPLRLLLVEDHAPTLQTVSNLLTRDGYYVVTAANITEALAAAQKDQFDLVISDLGLPDGTGIQLMEKLRAAYGLGGIALSGYGMEEDIARSYQAGFATHLVKPVSIGELRRALAKLGFGMAAGKG